MFSLFVLAVLGMSMGVPVGQSLGYDPQSFYPSGRIVGGTDAPEGYSPHQVALMVGMRVSSLMCGGSLVTFWHMLTAAHCIDPLLSWVDGHLLPSVHGLVGSNSLTGGYSVIGFSGHENHPDWDLQLIKYDVGVLRLARRLQPSARVQPISLNYDWVGGDQEVHVTGWGRLDDEVSVVDPRRPESNHDHISVWGAIPDKLQLLRMSTLSPAQCAWRVMQAVAQLGPSPPVWPHVELCTDHKKGAGHGTCYGDSGSAVVDTRGRQVALVSWGWPCARGHPDVHARVGGLRAWLERALAAPRGTRDVTLHRDVIQQHGGEDARERDGAADHELLELFE